ncbi:MAG TPA: hypothetical protein VGO62_18810, partial [Myxococcota bacterium]
MDANVSTWLPTVVFGALIAFILYRRVRRSFGKQRVATASMTIRMVLLLALCTFFLAWQPSLQGIAASAGGAVLGLVLAAVALRHTVLDKTAEGTFFTGNKWIGVVVTGLFFGRLAARMFAAYQQNSTGTVTGDPMAAMQKSPLTLAVYFLMGAYYIAYYSAVLVKAR